MTRSAPKGFDGTAAQWDVLEEELNIEPDLTAESAWAPVRFTLADGARAFDGWSEGETWNGWDVVEVEPSTMIEIALYVYDPQQRCCEHRQSAHKVDPADTRSITVDVADDAPREVTITGEPRCTLCACVAFDDGASNLSTIPLVRGRFSLHGYCTTIERDYSTSKFENAIAERAYAVVMDGMSEDSISDSDGMTVFDHVTTEEDSHVILRYDSLGFVWVEWSGGGAEWVVNGQKHWDYLVREYAQTEEED